MRCICSDATVMKHPCHGTMHAFKFAVNWLFVKSCAIASMGCSCIDKYLSESTSLQMVRQKTQLCTAVYSVMAPTNPHRMPVATTSTQKAQQLCVQAPASPPPWPSDKAADTHEPFLHNIQTSRGTKRASNMSPAPVKRRKANSDSQISPSRETQASSDQRQSKLACNSKLKQQEAGLCYTPRYSSGLRPLPIIPPITETDTYSRAFQLHTPKQSTAQEAAKLATQEQALQSSLDMPGVRCERPNSKAGSEANPTPFPSLLHPQSWSPTQFQLSWQSPPTPLCQSPSQTRVQPQRMPLVSPITLLDTLPCMYQTIALVSVHIFLHIPTPRLAFRPLPSAGRHSDLVTYFRVCLISPQQTQSSHVAK